MTSWDFFVWILFLDLRRHGRNCTWLCSVKWRLLRSSHTWLLGIVLSCTRGVVYYPAVMLGHVWTFQVWEFVHQVRKLKLVVDEILAFLVAPKSGEIRMLCGWNLNITAVTKQIAIYWKLVLKLMKLNKPLFCYRRLELIHLSMSYAAYIINIPWELAC